MSRSGQTWRFAATGKVYQPMGSDLRYEGMAWLEEEESVGFRIEGPVQLELIVDEGRQSQERDSGESGKKMEEEQQKEEKKESDVEAVSSNALTTTTTTADHRPPVESQRDRHRCTSPLSSRLDLLLPISVVKRRLTGKRNSTLQISDEAAVYVSAVVEYLCAELFDDGRVAAMARGADRQRPITADDIHIGVLNDPEMRHLLGGDVVYPTD